MSDMKKKVHKMENKASELKGRAKQKMEDMKKEDHKSG